ncbi:ATP-grasp domain-containing protein [Mesorhizobium sp. ANAO-SY3R2]|uniref:ATP-binding protein n=1 Tax=Mesorhizobium sp. ANAO-SY3R2 TaxID=3166644 RepID=UPI0036734D5C
MLLFAIQTSHFGSCRLPKALKEAGFCVGALAPRSSLVHASRYVDERFRLGARRFEPIIRHGIENAFKKFGPDLIVPCDEWAAAIVNHWVGKGGGSGRRLTPQLLQCLERSLGPLQRLPQRASKPDTLALARAIGVLCPRETIVEDFPGCEKAAGEYGYPVVLKLSHGAAGSGVKVCETREELKGAFGSFKQAQLKSDIMLRRLLRGDWFGSRLDILVQEHVSGQPGMSCASAVDGRTVSVLTGLVEATTSQTGPASVVHLANQPLIVDATIKMITAFGASGFVSFDFIVDDRGQTYLLECNPRPTPMLHLGPLVGVDLAKALLAGLQNGRCDTNCEVPAGERTVSIFPQEWVGDPSSPSLRATYHDVPWDDPTLLAAVMRKRPVRRLRRRFL